MVLLFNAPINLPGWLLLTCFLPIVGTLMTLIFILILPFIKGSKGKNKYGPNPKELQSEIEKEFA